MQEQKKLNHATQTSLAVNVADYAMLVKSSMRGNVQQNDAPQKLTASKICMLHNRLIRQKVSI